MSDNNVGKKRKTLVLMGTRTATVSVKLALDKMNASFHTIQLGCDAHFAENLRVLQEGHMNVAILFCIDYFGLNGDDLFAYLTSLVERAITPSDMTTYPMYVVCVECLTSTTQDEVTKKLLNHSSHRPLLTPWLEYIAKRDSHLMRFIARGDDDSGTSLLYDFLERRLNFASTFDDDQVQVSIRPNEDDSGRYVSLTIKRSRPQSKIVFKCMPSAKTGIIEEHGYGAYQCGASVFFMQETRLIESFDEELNFWFVEDDNLVLSLAMRLK